MPYPWRKREDCIDNVPILHANDHPAGENSILLPLKNEEETLWRHSDGKSVIKGVTTGADSILNQHKENLA